MKELKKMDDKLKEICEQMNLELKSYFTLLLSDLMKTDTSDMDKRNVLMSVCEVFFANTVMTLLEEGTSDHKERREVFENVMSGVVSRMETFFILSKALSPKE